MKKYRKKLVTVEAIQFTEDNLDEIIELRYLGWIRAIDASIGPDLKQRISIETLEGRMTAEPGDWIIRGVAGELYPCKPDIFEATYEEVSSDG